MYAGTGELSRDTVDKMLLAALQDFAIGGAFL